jgi:glycosyltransferase involved in cell wall biosynthesis
MDSGKLGEQYLRGLIPSRSSIFGGPTVKTNAECVTWQPTVTALVPCFNAAEFILRTLDSLSAQTWPSIEILIGDDCSSDDTFHILSEFARGRDDVRLVRRDQNMGWLRNSNDLMSRASGELMFFAFHDDIVAPNYVEKLVEALRSNPRAVLSFSDVEVFQPDGSSSALSFDRLSGLSGKLARGIGMARRPTNWWVPNRGLFRAWAFHRIGGIKPNDQGEYSADWTWLLHMSLLGEFVRVPEVLCRKFLKKGSLSRQWSHDRMQMQALSRAGIKEIRQSELGAIERLILISVIRIRGAFDLLPPGAKTVVKRVLQSA